MSKQICCEEAMTFLTGYDDPYGTIHAFNLYFCTSCGMIRKIDVWKNAGVLEIDVFNKITEK